MTSAFGLGVSARAAGSEHGQSSLKPLPQRSGPADRFQAVAGYSVRAIQPLAEGAPPVCGQATEWAAAHAAL